MHYPTCIAWRGKNAATTSNLPTLPSGFKSYEYEASAGSSNSVAIDNTFTQTLYADNPMGDYVNNFYTDALLTNVYSPTSPNEYINYKLKTATFTPNLPNFKLSGKGYYLQWIVGLDSTSGVRFSGTFSDRAKCSIIGTYDGTSGQPFPTGPGGGGFFKGTTRIYQDQ